MYRNLLVIFFLFAQALLLGAQDPGYVHIDKSSGLPSNSVYDILQDSRGYIWMATDAGLCRYDGYTFKVYTNEKQSSFSGSEIQEDRYGRIWYQNFDGFLFYVEDDSLKGLQQKSVLGYMPYGLAENTIFVCTKTGISLFDLQSLKMKKEIPLNTNRFVFTQECGNRYYFHKGTSLDVVDEQGNVSTVSADHPELLSYGKLVSNGEQDIWLYRSPGNCLAPSGNGFAPLFTKPEILLQSAAYSRGYVWFCSTTGAFAYDSLQRPFENGRMFFRDKSVSSVLCDRESNYWFSTTNEGVYFVSDIYSKNYFPGLNIRRLLYTGDELLAGTLNNSVCSIQPHEGISTTIAKNPYSHSVDLIESGDTLNRWFYVSDRLYVHSAGGISAYFGGEKDFEVIATGIYAVAASGYCGLFYDSRAPASPWKELPLDQNPPIGSYPLTHIMIDGVRGKSVCYDSLRGLIYFATNSGLFRCSAAGTEELRQDNESVYISRLTYYNGTVYALTTRNRLVTIDPEGNFGSFPPTGLSSIQGIKRQNEWLFVYSSNEIACCNLDTPQAAPRRISTYASDIYDLTLYYDELLIACSFGLLSVDFNAATDAFIHPLFHLDEVSVNGSRISTTDPELAALRYDRNNITISYSILSFKTANRYPLYYRVNNEPWVLCPEKSRELNFNLLPAGDYTVSFRLGQDADAFPVSEQVRFSIEKPWWAGSWSIAAYVIVLAGGIYFIYSAQMKRREKKIVLAKERAELENQLNQSVLTALKSQMNPHFFYNALNTIQSFIYSNDKQNAGNYLSKFSKLTRLVLEMSDQEEISLQEEITSLRLYLELEQARFENDFTFEIGVAAGTNTEMIRLPSMLIQPYVENAVKHGLLHKKGSKLVTVSFSADTHRLQVIIDDNGIGRGRSAELNAIRKDKPKSFSTEANTKRLELLNHHRKNQLSIQFHDKYSAEGMAEGTTVTINIPLEK